jgi:hypothetical protein
MYKDPTGHHEEYIEGSDEGEPKKLSQLLTNDSNQRRELNNRSNEQNVLPHKYLVELNIQDEQTSVTKIPQGATGWLDLGFTAGVDNGIRPNIGNGPVSTGFIFKNDLDDEKIYYGRIQLTAEGDSDLERPARFANIFVQEVDIDTGRLTGDPQIIDRVIFNESLPGVKPNREDNTWGGVQIFNPYLISDFRPSKELPKTKDHNEMIKSFIRYNRPDFNEKVDPLDEISDNEEQ